MISAVWFVGSTWWATMGRLDGPPALSSRDLLMFIPVFPYRLLPLQHDACIDLQNMGKTASLISIPYMDASMHSCPLVNHHRKRIRGEFLKRPSHFENKTNWKLYSFGGEI